MTLVTDSGGDRFDSDASPRGEEMTWSSLVIVRLRLEITVTDAGEAMRPRAEHVPAELSRAIGLDEHATEELRATLRQLTNAVSAAAT